MSNIQDNIVRLYPKGFKLSEKFLESYIPIIIEEFNVYGIIDFQFTSNWNFVDIWFTSKYVPTTINKIFKSKLFDIWILNTDEGGDSTKLYYLGHKSNPFQNFREKALFEFNRIEIIGDIKLIEKHENNIFGCSLRDLYREVRKEKKDKSVRYRIGGKFTCSCFSYERRGKGHLFRRLEEIENTIASKEFTFSDIVFFYDLIRFKEATYEKLMRGISPKEPFLPFIESISFYYFNQEISRMELNLKNKKGYSFIKHTSISLSFDNLLNHKFWIYQEKRKNTVANKASIPKT